MIPFKHSRMIGKILNFLTGTLREIEEEKSRWPEWKIEIKSRRTLRALTYIVPREGLDAGDCFTNKKT